MNSGDGRDLCQVSHQCSTSHTITNCPQLHYILILMTFILIVIVFSSIVSWFRSLLETKPKCADMKQ